MREQVVGLVGRKAYMWCRRFHSTCVRSPAQPGADRGLNSNFSIYDADDSRRLTDGGRDLGLDIKRYSPRLLANAISNLKNELIDPHQALAGNGGLDDLARRGVGFMSQV